MQCGSKTAESANEKKSPGGIVEPDFEDEDAPNANSRGIFDTGSADAPNLWSWVCVRSSSDDVLEG